MLNKKKKNKKINCIIDANDDEKKIPIFIEERKRMMMRERKKQVKTRSHEKQNKTKNTRLGRGLLIQESRSGFQVGKVIINDNHNKTKQKKNEESDKQNKKKLFLQ